MGDRAEALRLARGVIDELRKYGSVGVIAEPLARALLDAEAEIERLRARTVLTPLTEADVVAALHEGHAKRRAAEGDNAWTSLLRQRDEARAEIERLRPVYEAALLVVATARELQVFTKRGVTSLAIAADHDRAYRALFAAIDAAESTKKAGVE